MHVSTACDDIIRAFPRPGLPEDGKGWQGMLGYVSKIFVDVLGAGCIFLRSSLSFGGDLIVGCYRSSLVQGLLTIVENVYIDVTGRVYYASGAAVGTVEGLWLVARHVPLPLPPQKPLARPVTGTLASNEF